MALAGAVGCPETEELGLDLTPGITGYWQILGRNSIPFQEMLEVDYSYVAGWSLWHDVRIFLRTIPVLLRRPGVN